MRLINRIELEDARKVLAGAQAKAVEIGIPMCVAVVDESGNLIAFERMDGGKVTSTAIAIDKAYTAAGARRATHEAQMAAQPGSPAFGINSTHGGRFVIVGGGLPIMFDDEVVAGIGVSSGTPEQDRLVAQAGIDAFLGNRG